MLRRVCVIVIIVSIAMLMPIAAFGWKFASIADSRGDNNGVNISVLSNIVNRINAEGVDLVIFQGDAVNGSSSDATCASQMDTWLSVINNLNCPWYFVPGNHEIQSATQQENVLRPRVNMPLNGPAGDLEMVYWFEHENARFIGLNSNHYGQAHHVQLSWLQNNIQTDKPHIFVYAHEPAYPVGGHIGSSLDAYPAERDQFWNILGAAGVKMYFCGHEHLYHRSLHNGIYQVINGTCGAPFHYATGAISEYHYVVVTVDGNNVSAKMVNDSGVVRDTWSYTVTAPTDVTCASAKLMPNGSYVRLTNKIVTYVRGSAIYVEEDDRTAAFRATGISGISVGDRVTIVGTLQTNAFGEREIAGSAYKLSSGNALPKPLGMTNRSVLGGPFGYNPGADGAYGCNTSSMLIKIFGRVTKVGTGSNAGMFYIDDGSGITDGTVWDYTPNVGIRVVWPGSVTVGETQTVTGICSSFKVGSKICRMIYCTDSTAPAAWTAYNDVVYSAADGHPALQPNVTTINIGSGSPGPSSGMLKDFATGADTGVTATFTQSGGVVWQPSASGGGWDCNVGTDAYNTFNPSTASLIGVVYYGSSGWYVDLTFTGLNPTKTYEFATSANRNESTYLDRMTKYTIMGADSFTNSSTPGATITDGGASTVICTGYNTVNGYVARWTNIRPGADGSFTVRAQAATSQYKAYAFSAFKLVQNP